MVKFEMPIEQFTAEFKQQLATGLTAEEALKHTFLELGAEYLIQVERVVLEGFPLNSMLASGKYRDKIFCTRNGKTYLKRYTKPRNPNTPGQISQRNAFAEAAQLWGTFTEPEKQEYNQRAKGTNLSEYCT